MQILSCQPLPSVPVADELPYGAINRPTRGLLLSAVWSRTCGPVPLSLWSTIILYCGFFTGADTRFGS